MKIVQWGLCLLVAISFLSACNEADKKKDETKSVTRISYARGFDMQSSRMDSPVAYDEQGRVIQIDFIDKVIYEDDKVTAIYKPGNVTAILRNELTLENGKPVSIYAEYRNPADSTSQELFMTCKGTFSQKGDTLFAEEYYYEGSSDKVLQKSLTQWITDDKGYLKHRNIKMMRDKDEYSYLSTCSYDETQICPDMATAYFVSLMGATDFLLLVSGNQPGIMKNMLSHVEMTGVPYTSIDFFNEYDDKGLCVRALYKSETGEVLSDIALEYETVVVE